jgi:hypothetical protein
MRNYLPEPAELNLKPSDEPPPITSRSARRAAAIELCTPKKDIRRPQTARCPQAARRPQAACRRSFRCLDCFLCFLCLLCPLCPLCQVCQVCQVCRVDLPSLRSPRDLCDAQQASPPASADTSRAPPSGLHAAEAYSGSFTASKNQSECVFD